MPKIPKNKIFIVIPAFNEEPVIGSVIDDLHKEGYENIIVVDDGSSDKTYKVTRSKKCIALKHLINRGKGAATQTGLDAVKLFDYEAVVTMDADGQHYAEDVEKLAIPILKSECDVVLGSRLLGNSIGMPVYRKIMNYIANITIFVFYGIFVSDSQSGFRAYSKLANTRIKTEQDKYEFDSEVLHKIQNLKLKYKEVPIKVRYTEHSLNKYANLRGAQSQNFMNGIRMVFKMIVRSILT